MAGTQHASFRYDFSGRGDIVLTEPAAHGAVDTVDIENTGIVVKTK